MKDVDQKAAEMFAAGESVNAVAKELEITWAAAKKLQTGGAAQDGVSPAAKPKRGRPRAAEREPEPEPEAAPEIWDMTLYVPRATVPALFASFSEGEQATAVMSVLQSRLDATLGGE